MKSEFFFKNGALEHRCALGEPALGQLLRTWGNFCARGLGKLLTCGVTNTCARTSEGEWAEGRGKQGTEIRYHVHSKPLSSKHSQEFHNSKP